MTNPMIENLEKMLAAGKDSAMLRFGLGSAYFNEKKFSEAAKHLEACISQDKNYSAAYSLLGRAMESSGDSAAARQVFETGLAVAKDKGDKQTQRQIEVFLKKLARRKKQ